MSSPRKGKEYKTWARMISRCHDESDQRYPWYGGRGIAVCPEWREDFDRFLEDMGPAPTPTHTIERKDNDAGYSKGNCKWATWKEQAQNRRTTINIVHAGRTLSMAAWAELKKMDRRILFKRLKAGWDVAAAIETPVAPRTRRAA